MEPSELSSHNWLLVESQVPRTTSIPLVVSSFGMSRQYPLRFDTIVTSVYGLVGDGDMEGMGEIDGEVLGPIGCVPCG